MSSRHSALAHHFYDLDQQHDAATLGMWAFLAQEIMFFGVLFLGYTIYRMKYPGAFIAGSNELNPIIGAINTAVLIGSSMTMAMAVQAAQFGRRKLIVLFLILTLVLGAIFLGIKSVEYTDKFHHHLIPIGDIFHYEGPLAGQVKIFFSFYFVMTGMHALHMIIGIGIMIPLIVRAIKGHFNEEYSTPVELFGLYWHFVDIVWIFLFPLLYLIGRS